MGNPLSSKGREDSPGKNFSGRHMHCGYDQKFNLLLDNVAESKSLCTQVNHIVSGNIANVEKWPGKERSPCMDHGFQPIHLFMSTVSGMKTDLWPLAKSFVLLMHPNFGETLSKDHAMVCMVVQVYCSTCRWHYRIMYCTIRQICVRD